MLDRSSSIAVRPQRSEVWADLSSSEIPRLAGLSPAFSGSSSSARTEGKSFAESVRGAQTKEAAERARLAALPLCEYHMISGACPDKKCRAVHGDLCEICSKYIVHPHNPEFNEQHVKECRETHEKVRQRDVTIPYGN